eukprot:Em0016g256a
MVGLPTYVRLVIASVKSILDLLCSIDEQVTGFLCICARPRKPWEKLLEFCCKSLEFSGHGVLWFVLCGCLAAAYALTNENMYWIYSANLFVLLVVDIAFVAPLKLLFKRPRPAMNIGEIPFSVSSVDNYAFPSGHASRCVALAAYFCYMPPFLLRTHLWYLWAIAMSLSRVLIGRHHFSDIVAGGCAGLVIFEAVRRLWLPLVLDD